MSVSIFRVALRELGAILVRGGIIMRILFSILMCVVFSGAVMAGDGNTCSAQDTFCLNLVGAESLKALGNIPPFGVSGDVTIALNLKDENECQEKWRGQEDNGVCTIASLPLPPITIDPKAPGTQVWWTSGPASDELRSISLNTLNTGGGPSKDCTFSAVDVSKIHEKTITVGYDAQNKVYTCQLQ